MAPLVEATAMADGRAAAGAHPPAGRDDASSASSSPHKGQPRSRGRQRAGQGAPPASSFGAFLAHQRFYSDLLGSAVAVPILWAVWTAVRLVRPTGHAGEEAEGQSACVAQLASGWALPGYPCAKGTPAQVRCGGVPCALVGRALEGGAHVVVHTVRDAPHGQ